MTITSRQRDEILRRVRHLEDLISSTIRNIRSDEMALYGDKQCKKSLEDNKNLNLRRSRLGSIFSVTEKIIINFDYL